jgi:hypothetical protein
MREEVAMPPWVRFLIHAGIALLVVGACVLAVPPRFVAAGQQRAPVLAPSTPPAQQAGRPLSRSDWLARAPLALACIVLVVAVDTAVVVRIVRKRRQQATRPWDHGPTRRG